MIRDIMLQAYSEILRGEVLLTVDTTNAAGQPMRERKIRYNYAMYEVTMVLGKVIKIEVVGVGVTT